MKPALKRLSQDIYYYSNGEKNQGHTAEVIGDLTYIRGDLTGIRGDLTGVRGNLTGVSGDIDDCKLTSTDRDQGIDIEQLVGLDYLS